MPENSFRARGVAVEREEVTEEELRALGVDLPSAQASDFRRYPVISEDGWRIVVKNKDARDHPPRTRETSRPDSPHLARSTPRLTTSTKEQP